MGIGFLCVRLGSRGCQTGPSVFHLFLYATWLPHSFHPCFHRSSPSERVAQASPAHSVGPVLPAATNGVWEPGNRDFHFLNLLGCGLFCVFLI